MIVKFRDRKVFGMDVIFIFFLGFGGGEGFDRFIFKVCRVRDKSIDRGLRLWF